MGLQVTINAEQDCENTQISFWDDTPDYNASTAPYGYGTPNVARGDADSDGVPDIPVTTFSWFHEDDLTGFIGSTLLSGVYQGKDVGFLPTTSATTPEVPPVTVLLSKFVNVPVKDVSFTA